MNVILNSGNWNELKIKLMEKYPQLTVADMDHKEGMEEEMLRMIEYKLGKSKQELKEIISEYYSFYGEGEV
jgi:hypothetical protein